MKPKEHIISPTRLDVRKVIVADDDETTRILLRMSLTQWGYQVREAADGEEAWKILLEPESPQILILDWLMPNLDGISLCKRIENELSFHPYIIFLTGMSGTENMIQGLEAGADEFILKPFDLAELRIRVFAGERIIKYRQQIEEQNKQLQSYVEKLKKYAADNVTANFPSSDLLKLLQEILDTLGIPDLAQQKNKIQELKGKLKNFVDIIKNSACESAEPAQQPKIERSFIAVPPAIITQENTAILNIKRMQDFFGDDLIAIKDFIKTFISSAKKQIQSIDSALKNKDAANAKYYFHLLGSASGNSGIMQMYDICGKGEKNVNAEHWEEAHRCYLELASIVTQLEEELTKL